MFGARSFIITIGHTIKTATLMINIEASINIAKIEKKKCHHKTEENRFPRLNPEKDYTANL